MWKNFFYFSGSQRAGILVLFFLILMISLIDCFLPVFFEPEVEQTDHLFLVEVIDFQKSLQSIDSVNNAQRLHNYQSYNYSSSAYNKTAYKKTPTLFPFNPNELDSSGFVALGIKPYVVSNILKYRRKISFRDKESFARIYGLSAEKYNELAKYIQLPDVKHVRNDSACRNVDKVVENHVFSVELNTADTAELMQVKGIGRAYARAIVRFRKQTGGFNSIEQLNEIYGMTPENFDKIKTYCTVNPELIQKISINIASVEKLKAHPYLNFYQAKQIYELRRKKGKLSGIGELTKLSELNEITIRKISAYLNFE
jgi:competence ComEA-like helix-hairpin-helix protein